ncbi:hotdog domain-containing protein [Bacillus sp. es.034]|uniref:thioesterase family protein n=1 Tax=Bacillus sp. es.034 TaxID=1761763 RepID=UPI000BF48851|nr:hotdog domain-containing protein [Bacillus sp. es.034]PFG03755.1 thioesterase superfamily protein [Bacillus sp. es.034]
MKSGLAVGHTAIITTEVTPGMYAQFEGNVVHPVYSTLSMVYHMEWASRKGILPYLEDHEEGMGAKVNVEHMAPAKTGSLLEIRANVIEYERNVIVTEVTVRERENGRLIGKGEVKQVVLPKEKINERIKES